MTDNARLKSRDLDTYDKIFIACSGGKDSVAALLELLNAGADPVRIELHHHLVDGDGPTFMDWPSASAYVAALGQHLGLVTSCSWRAGGFERELWRTDCPTAPVRIKRGGFVTERGGNGPTGTRRRFPQVSSNLSVRWCSAALKIDVMDAVLRDDPDLRNARTLVVTGERAEESANRARYADFEPHRADARSGRLKRHIDHYRPVLRHNEARIWSALRHANIDPYVAYHLGWSRLSCRACIFMDADQAASLRAFFPARFDRIVEAEARTGATIKRHVSLSELADRGRVFEPTGAIADLIETAESDSPVYRRSMTVRNWIHPAGAYRNGAGPS